MSNSSKSPVPFSLGESAFLNYSPLNIPQSLGLAKEETWEKQSNLNKNKFPLMS